MRTKMIGVAAAAAMTLVIAGPASARQTANTQGNADAQAQGAASEAKDEKKVCRVIESTGTRMAKRACHTAADWKKIDERKF